MSFDAEAGRPIGAIVHGLRWAVAIFRRWRWLALLGLLLGGLGGGGARLVQDDQFRTSATISFRTPVFDSRSFATRFFYSAQDPAQVAAANFERLTARRVARFTASALHDGTTSEQVRNAISVSARGQSGVFDITATAPSGQRAAVLSLTYANQYLALRRADDASRYTAAVSVLARRLRSLPAASRRGRTGAAVSERIGDLQVVQALQDGNAEVIDDPSVPSAPIGRNTLASAAVGGLVGLLLGLGAGAIRDLRLARRVQPE